MRRHIALGLILLALSVAGCMRTDQQITADVQKKLNSDGNVPGSQVAVNASGGVAHVSFGDSPIQFMVGSANSTVKFTEPGTYKYYVHISGVKGHAHSGNVVVK